MDNNIIQWNCRGLRANFTDFRLLCDKYNPIVCCLQETMLTKDDFIIRGFNCIHLTGRDIGGRACGGVSVLVRDGIPSSECTLNTSLQAKAVTISTSKTITICSLYLPPSENLSIVLLSRLIDQLPAPFVICGDFNRHSITWGCDKNNSRGDRIDDFITDNNICLLNDGSYTYLHPATGTFTAIDLSLCSPDILMEIDFMVESDSYGSDHFPIILKIGVSLPDALPRWNFNRADWVQFYHLCKEQLTLDTIELYDEPIVLFTDVLCDVAKSCMPRATAKQKKRCKPWFNTECKDAMKARKSALVRFKTNITADNLSNFRIARAKARRACRDNVVVVVCPLQPSSSVNSGCPGPESSILVSSRWACPISSQVTDHWGELRNRTDEVHPVDPFHSLDILKNHSASVAFCRNLGVYNVQNGAVIELSFVVSVKGFPRH